MFCVTQCDKVQISVKRSRERNDQEMLIIPEESAHGRNFVILIFFLNEANSKPFDIKCDFLTTYLGFFLGMQIMSWISKPSRESQ